MPVLVPSPLHGSAIKPPANGIFCSRQDTEGLKVGIGGAEPDGLRRKKTLSYGQDTHKRNTVSPVSAGLPPLFTLFPVFGSGPHHKQQHGWIWFHSFSQRKQTQTVSPAVCWPGGHQGRQAGFVLPGTLHAAGPGLGWALRAAPAVSATLAQAPAAPCILLVREAACPSPWQCVSGCCTTRMMMKPSLVWYSQDRSPCRPWVQLAELLRD